jgi:hypothetical protein
MNFGGKVGQGREINCGIWFYLVGGHYNYSHESQCRLLLDLLCQF